MANMSHSRAQGRAVSQTALKLDVIFTACQASDRQLWSVLLVSVFVGRSGLVQTHWCSLGPFLNDVKSCTNRQLQPLATVGVDETNCYFGSSKHKTRICPGGLWAWLKWNMKSRVWLSLRGILSHAVWRVKHETRFMTEGTDVLVQDEQARWVNIVPSGMEFMHVTGR